MDLPLPDPLADIANPEIRRIAASRISTRHGSIAHAPELAAAAHEEIDAQWEVFMTLPRPIVFILRPIAAYFYNREKHRIDGKLSSSLKMDEAAIAATIAKATELDKNPPPTETLTLYPDYYDRML